jgi:adenine deaminase
MNRVVRHAIAQGVKPITAIQMATINTAQHFGVERELGSIAPGRRADLIVTSDIASLPIEMVFARGQLLAENGILVADIPAYEYPESAKNTVKLGKVLAATDFDIAANDVDKVDVRVIGVVENQAPTKALQRNLRL